MDIMDMEELSTRAKNALRRNGILTVETLKERLKTPRSLLKIRQIGDTTMKQIEKAFGSIILDVEPWAEEEISTRNCFNAKVKGSMVHCSRGHELSQPYNEVVKAAKLYSPCSTCADIDIDW
jgi:hypothetical protein